MNWSTRAGNQKIVLIWQIMRKQGYSGNGVWYFGVYHNEYAIYQIKNKSFMYFSVVLGIWYPALMVNYSSTLCHQSYWHCWLTPLDVSQPITNIDRFPFGPVFYQPTRVTNCGTQYLQTLLATKYSIFFCYASVQYTLTVLTKKACMQWNVYYKYSTI